jgi:penicillin-binding protein 1A
MAPRRPYRGSHQLSPSRSGGWLKRLLILISLIVVMGLLGLGTGIGLMVSQIPPVEQLLAARPRGATTIYDRDNRVIASLQDGENRSIVPLQAIAPTLQQAVIASEDIRFYEHIGIDPRGVARALLYGGKAGGGSTLTQQLAKVLFTRAERTVTRKIADMWLALQLERTLSKDKILEMYLNQVYFGHGAYGVEAASRKYFAKKASAINVAEAAILAGLLPAPEYYSPYRNLKLCKEVQGVVLQRMVNAGFIQADAAKKAAEAPLRFANTPDYAYRAPYFTSHVLSYLSEQYGEDVVMRGALRIYTTLDLPLQEAAETLIRDSVKRYRRMNVGQGALVALEPRSGDVRVLVGGTSYDASQFNRATQAHRQPGSTFKPFVYLSAFMRGKSPGSVLVDAPARFGAYAPQNYDHRYHGSVTLARALAFSYNIPAVKLADEVGIQNVIDVAQAAGINSPLPANLSVALGSAEVTPLELTNAYATLAAEGVRAEPRFIVRIENSEGQLLRDFGNDARPVIQEDAIWALNSCLMGVVQYGTGAAANFGRHAAGKTGTTSDNRDTWFAGYTPDLACVIWLGNDDNSRLNASATGGGLAAPLWAKFMRRAHQSLPARQLRTGVPAPVSTPSPSMSPISQPASEAPDEEPSVPEPIPSVEENDDDLEPPPQTPAPTENVVPQSPTVTPNP